MTNKTMSFASMINQLFSGVITKGTFRDSREGHYRVFDGKLQWVDPDPDRAFIDDEEDINVSLELVSMTKSVMVGS